MRTAKTCWVFFIYILNAFKMYPKCTQSIPNGHIWGAFNLRPHRRLQSTFWWDDQKVAANSRARCIVGPSRSLLKSDQKVIRMCPGVRALLKSDQNVHRHRTSSIKMWGFCPLHILTYSRRTMRASNPRPSREVLGQDGHVGLLGLLGNPKTLTTRHSNTPWSVPSAAMPRQDGTSLGIAHRPCLATFG